MYELKLIFRDKLIPLGEFLTADDAHWAAAEWRQKYGRPTAKGDPFKVCLVTAIPVFADEIPGLKVLASIPAR